MGGGGGGAVPGKAPDDKAIQLPCLDVIGFFVDVDGGCPWETPPHYCPVLILHTSSLQIRCTYVHGQ